MKTSDGRPVSVLDNEVFVGKRKVMALPPGGVEDLLAGMQQHTSPLLENYAATEDGRDVGLACKADRMVFFVSGRRVMEVPNTDLGELAEALRGKSNAGSTTSATASIQELGVTTPTTADLIRAFNELPDELIVDEVTAPKGEDVSPNAGGDRGKAKIGEDLWQALREVQAAVNHLSSVLLRRG